jgi:hypothetical protein
MGFLDADINSIDSLAVILFSSVLIWVSLAINLGNMVFSMVILVSSWLPRWLYWFLWCNVGFLYSKK